ncbi:FAD binding domain-containing protein [Niallia sp. 03133]|uniref:FAD binding domain-containing protein n=1 Tax=Niallia sp. 03133 TaxID=3458060 RepID=UPI00404400E9
MNFDYFLPTKLEEAATLYQTLTKEKKSPMFYGGGTEILTLGRLNIVQTKAVIDIKKINECQAYQLEGDYLAIGSALTLTEIESKNLFPLLTAVAKEVADRTARNKITFGGNLLGLIIYREMILPLLLTDSILVIKSGEKIKTASISSIYKDNLQIKKGELFVQALIEKQYLTVPYAAVKKRQQWETGYPLITAAAIKINNEIRIAFSGLCPYPFRSKEMEIAINNPNLSKRGKIESAMDKIPAPVLDDIEGSAEYRLFVLKNLMNDIVDDLSHS